MRLGGPVNAVSGRILMIDDDEHILEEAGRALTSAGHDVTATSRTVGMAKFLREVDVVVLDFHMPGLDGAEVVASLRAASATLGDAAPHFYIYTTDLDAMRRAKEFGFDGVIKDKGNMQALVHQAGMAIRLRRLRGLVRSAAG